MYYPVIALFFSKNFIYLFTRQRRREIRREGEDREGKRQLPHTSPLVKLSSYEWGLGLELGFLSIVTEPVIALVTLKLAPLVTS